MTLKGGELGAGTLNGPRPSTGGGLLPVGPWTTNLHISTGLRAQASASLTVTPVDAYGLQRLSTIGDRGRDRRPQAVWIDFSGF